MSVKRIQRRRTKGWRMPDNTIYVGRGSKWGNPYKVGDKGFLAGEPFEVLGREHAAMLYRMLIAPLVATTTLRELRGKNLACWCPLDAACHADVLLELANQQIDQVKDNK